MVNDLINTSLISTGQNGQVRFSGLSSGLDVQGIINATVDARRAVTVQPIEDKVTLTNSRIDAFTTLKGLTGDFTSVLDKLRGSNSFFSEDVFDTRLAFATSKAAAGAPVGHSPSNATDLVGVTAAKNTATASHSVIINQLAAAHQVRSDALTSKTDTLDSQGITAGSFSINGSSISVSTTDNLIDLVSKINNANIGTNASIVSADATTHYLVVTSEDTGLTNTIDFAGGTATSDSLGLTNGGVVKNELVSAQNAQLTVNGITGIERESNEIDDVLEGITLSLFAAEADTEITIDVEPDLNAVKTTIAEFVEGYNALREFYNEQRSEIDRDDDGEDEFGVLAFDGTLSQIINRLGGIAAQEVNQLPDGFRSLGQVGVTLSSDYNLQIDDSIIDNKLLTDIDAVRRLFAFDFNSSDSRVTYLDKTEATQSYLATANSNILDSELTDPGDLTGTDYAPNTVTITTDVQDPTGLTDAITLTSTAIAGSAIFTQPFNVTPNTTYTMSFYVKDLTGGSIRMGYYDQVDPIKQQFANYESVVSGEYNRVSMTFTTDPATTQIVMAPVFGLEDTESVTIYGLKLEEGSEVTSYENGPDYFYLNAAGTDGNGDVTDANIKTAINISAGGVGDGSATLDGQKITATDQIGADGLTVLFNADPSLGAQTDIRMQFSRGVADQLYDFFNEFSKTQGTFDNIIEDLGEQQVAYESDIEVQESRIEIFRSTQERKYLAMETALLQLENLRNQIDQLFGQSEN